MRLRLGGPLLGGASGVLAAASVITTPQARAQSVSSVVWMAPTCKAEPERTNTESPLGAILGIVLGPLIEMGIKGLGDAITKAGAPRDIHGVGTLNTNLYRVEVPWNPAKPNQPTLHFARGCLVAAFGPAVEGGTSPARFAADQQENEVRPLDLAGNWSKTLDDRLGGVLDPKKTSILVASLELSDDRTAFRFVPQFVRLGDAFDGKRKQRSLSFTTSLLPPGGTADGTAVAVRTITFPNVTAALDVNSRDAELSATSWMPVPPVPDGVKARIGEAALRLSDAYTLTYSLESGQLEPAARIKAQQELDRLRQLITDERDPAILSDREALATIAPFTVRVDAHQTRPGSTFLTKLGEFLSGNAGKLATPVADAINPQTRAAAAETETQRVEALRATAITEAGKLAEATAANDQTAVRLATLKLGAACRQIRDAGFSDLACLGV